MPDILSQFYASPKELYAFATTAAAEFNLYVVAGKFPPFEIEKIHGEQIEELFRSSPRYREIAFMVDPPELSANGRMEFIDKNPDQLNLQLGRQTQHGLEESSLSARTDNPNAFAIWRKIANKLKKQTKSGITAINRESGASGFYRSFRYTVGAETLEATGVAMIPPQGPNGPRIVLGMRGKTT